MPRSPMKDAMAMKLMSAMAERDAAVRQRDVAINEKNAALAEREVVILHRDAAYAERNAAFTERDEAIAALQYARGNRITGIPNGPVVDSRSGSKHMSSDVSYQTRDSSPAEAYPTISADVVLEVNPRRMKPSRKGPEAASGSKPSGPRKSKRLAAGEGLNEQLSVTKHKWNDQDMGLNQVRFDELTMPTPVCSCTGFRQPCYKWGNGGWQSACCTTTISMYPLPCRPNKRRSRMSGRKMSGGAFNKVLNKLATEGHDLSMPLDLKDHWAKHGTNRYTTIK